MGLYLRQIDLDRLERAFDTILAPLAFDDCDAWRLAVERTVTELIDGDHAVFAMPHAGQPFHVHSVNVAERPHQAIQAIFGGLPDLPADPWLQQAEVARQSSGVQVWSRLRAFWRAADGDASARRRSPFIGEVVTPGAIYDSENIDWTAPAGHVALCVSYSNISSSVRQRRASPRYAAAPLLQLLLPAFKAGVAMRLDHDARVGGGRVLERYDLTPREAQVAQLLSRRATNREIAEQLGVSPHTVRHHIEGVFAKLGVHSRRAIARRLDMDAGAR
jgi:DNA-binding CsgD family transcriptional regulator